MSSLQTFVIKDGEGFKELEVEWRSLWGASGSSVTLFSSFEWYKCWWNHFSDANKGLFIIVVKESGQVSGIAPLMLERASFRFLPVRVARFIENGNSLHNDFCLSATHQRPLVEAVLDCLMKHRGLWDMLEFKNIPDDSENIALLLEFAEKRGIICEVKPALDSPYIDIRYDWEQFYAKCSPRARKTHRNLFNTISKGGEYRLIRLTTFREYEAYREAIFDIAVNSWTAGIGDCLASSCNRGFFDELSRVAAELDWLDIWLLEFNGRAIAFEYHLHCNGRNHALRASYNEKFARLSPGAVLDLLVIKELCNNRNTTHEYDLGGSCDSYKKKWTPAVRGHKIIHMFKPESYSRMLHRVEYGVIPVLRRVRTALKQLRGRGGGA